MRGFDRYADLGVERCLFLLPALPPGEALRRLDDMAKVAGASDR